MVDENIIMGTWESNNLHQDPETKGMERINRHGVCLYADTIYNAGF